jgi:hypothetical protein
MQNKEMYFKNLNENNGLYKISYDKGIRELNKRHKNLSVKIKMCPHCKIHNYTSNYSNRRTQF